MSLNTHARCDWCEEVLIAEDEDELVESGWLVVRFGIADERQDFCCLPCLSKWSLSDSAVETVSNANEESTEDE